LFALAGGFGDLEELDDLAARLGRITLEGFLLHFQAEALAFLFPTADPCQCCELLHGGDLDESASNNRPTSTIIVTASSGVMVAS
jgi:hypothetical protein